MKIFVSGFTIGLIFTFVIYNSTHQCQSVNSLSLESKNAIQQHNSSQAHSIKVKTEAGFYANTHEFNPDHEKLLASIIPEITKTIRSTIQHELNEHAESPSGSAYQDSAHFEHQQENISNSEKIIADAISDGQWNPRHSVALRELINNLPADEQQRLLAKVTHAINNKELVLSHGMMVP